MLVGNYNEEFQHIRRAG